MARCGHSDAVGGFEIWTALVNGLLIAIPLWVILGLALALVFQLGLLEQAGSAALMIAAVCEAILLRPLLRPYLRKLRAAMHVLRDKESPQSALEKAAGRHYYSIEDLLRHVESHSPPPIRARPAAARRPVVAPYSIFRQALTLSALVGAYLQYYFLEVELQIAALRPLTVFVPVTSMT